MPIDMTQRREKIKSLTENLKEFVKKNKGTAYSKEDLGNEFPDSIENDYLDEVLKKLVKSKFLKENMIKGTKVYEYNPEQDSYNIGPSMVKNGKLTR